jgi:hypothetical protein
VCAVVEASWGRYGLRLLRDNAVRAVVRGLSRAKV